MDFCRLCNLFLKFIFYIFRIYLRSGQEMWYPVLRCNFSHSFKAKIVVDLNVIVLHLMKDFNEDEKRQRREEQIYSFRYKYF